MRAFLFNEGAKVSILVKLLLIVFFLLPLLQIGATRGESLSLKPSDIANSSKPEPEITIEVTYAEYIPPKPPVRVSTAIPRPVGNNFPYGQCTWGVANLRAVSWSGNAYQWWANSAGIRPRGSTPRVGAIMVSWESPLGHVAYVTGVNANGSFTVKEMNSYYNGGGWGRYNYRTIYPGTIRIIGFIY